jgi:RNA polymerase sigma-70 factor (ECF subfamily)
MTAKKDNTIQLLETAFKKGEKNAFKALYNMYFDKLFVYINSYTNDRSLTQDIVQDTFVKVWNNKEIFDIKQSLGGYLYKTAYHTFIDNYRKVQKNHKLLDTLAYKRMNDLIEEDKDEKDKKIKKIKEAIEKLPPKCKEIFLLSKYQGYKYNEIAEHLNISPKTVEAQMGRAFLIIRKEIKDDDCLNLFLCFYMGLI